MCKGGGTLAHGGVKMLGFHDLHKWHAGHRVEEMNARYAFWMKQFAAQIVQGQAGRVAGENSTRFKTGFNVPVECTFDVGIFSDSFQDQIGVSDAVAVDIGDESIRS